MYRYKLTIEYDGTNLTGWQKQQHLPSVQQILEQALENFLQEPVKACAAGRTDAGVHARGQVVHFDTTKEHPPYIIIRALNFYLKKTPLSVLAAEPVETNFHARFSATKRHYQYIIINRISSVVLEKNRVWHVKEYLDIELMRQAAIILVGTHDFTSFRATECQSKSPIKTLEQLAIDRIDERIIIKLSARSFLHHMCRNIVGTLRLVGNGKWPVEQVAHALLARNRKACGPAAPACGLYLEKIEY
jgi:tRNA pseudouridine38-40 synthase